jgi:uncharacterized membrane protein
MCYNLAVMANKQTPSDVKIKTPKSLAKVLPFILVVGGIIGLFSSFILAYDQIKIWENPSYQPACSLNPILNCGSVIDSGEGKVFGIPGPFFGLITFSVLLTIGAAMLAGAKFKRWFWLGLQAGAIGGFGFGLWLFLLSIFRINALCPFCLTVDAVVAVMLWYITLYNFEQKVLVMPSALQKVPAFIRRHHLDILVLWFLLVVAFILKHFWYYYGKHLF